MTLPCPAKFLLLAVAIGLLSVAGARAQDVPPADPAAAAQPAAPPPAKKKFNPYGTPLDTILSTRLWTDVPAAQQFVRESRPDPKTLTYTPLTGKDPDRPKPRDEDGVAALQAELEGGITKNAAARDDLLKTSNPAPAKQAKKPGGHAGKAASKSGAKPGSLKAAARKPKAVAAQ